jgi:hypothetical protein
MPENPWPMNTKKKRMKSLAEIHILSIRFNKIFFVCEYQLCLKFKKILIALCFSGAVPYKK